MFPEKNPAPSPKIAPAGPAATPKPETPEEAVGAEKSDLTPSGSNEWKEVARRKVEKSATLPPQQDVSAKEADSPTKQRQQTKEQPKQQPEQPKDAATKTDSREAAHSPARAAATDSAARATSNSRNNKNKHWNYLMWIVRGVDASTTILLVEKGEGRRRRRKGKDDKKREV